MRWPPLCARAAPKAPGVGSQGPQQGALCWFKGAHRLPGLGLRRAVWPGAGRCTSLCQSRSFASQDRSTAPYRAKTRGRLVNAGPVSRRGRRHQPCPPPPLEDAQPEAARTQPRPREPAEGSAPSAAQTARLAPTPFPDLSLSGGGRLSPGPSAAIWPLFPKDGKPRPGLKGASVPWSPASPGGAGTLGTSPAWAPCLPHRAVLPPSRRGLRREWHPAPPRGVYCLPPLFAPVPAACDYRERRFIHQGPPPASRRSGLLLSLPPRDPVCSGRRVLTVGLRSLGAFSVGDAETPLCPRSVQAAWETWKGLMYPVRPPAGARLWLRQPPPPPARRTRGLPPSGPAAPRPKRAPFIPPEESRFRLRRSAVAIAWSRKVESPSGGGQGPECPRSHRHGPRAWPAGPPRQVVRGGSRRRRAPGRGGAHGGGLQ